MLEPESRSTAIERLNRLRHAAGRGAPTPREAAESWEIIRGFTVEDIQAYLAELPPSSERGGNLGLINMLFHRWGQLDPAAAAKEAMQPAYKENRNLLHTVMVAWADRDLDGMMRWAAADNSDEARRAVSNVAGRLLVVQDPKTALARAAAECPEAASGVLYALAREMSGTPESRREFVELATGKVDPQEWLRCLKQFASICSERDPEGAIGVVSELEGMGLPADQVAAFRDYAVSNSTLRSPEAALDQMLLPESNIPPEKQLSAYRNWAASEPEAAIAWAQRNGKPDFVGETVKQRALDLLHTGWQPGVNDEKPWIKGFLTHFDAWKRQQPDAAAAWLQTMPSDVRGRLNTTPTDVPR